MNKTKSSPCRRVRRSPEEAKKLYDLLRVARSNGCSNTEAAKFAGVGRSLAHYYLSNPFCKAGLP